MTAVMRNQLCPHEQLSAEVAVRRLCEVTGGPVTSYLAEVRIRCMQCGVPFEFLGLQPGLNLLGAAMSVDAHIVPHGQKPTPLDLIGYSIRGHQA